MKRAMRIPALGRARRLRQRFDEARIPDVPGALASELAGCGVTVRPGERIAIAVGSRGIANLPAIVRGVVEWVKGQGGEPFLVPAMGSHGGATPEGQTAVLAGYGVTEATVGAPVRATMEVVELDRAGLPVPSFVDAHAAAADGTILINRVKVHTSFHGPHESGLMKMATIGLGKQAQALAIHRHGVPGLRDLIPAVARNILARGNIRLGVGLLENAYDQTCRLRAVATEAIEATDRALLEFQRSVMPSLPVEEVDILIVDEMGKNFSGTGMDTNIIGRLLVPGMAEPERPRIKMIVVRDLSDAAHGNGLGMGLADVTTRRLFDKLDLAATYENIYTTTFLQRGKIPIIAESDREALGYALRPLELTPPEDLRILRIRNTLEIEEMLASPAVVADLAEADTEADGSGKGPAVEITDETVPWFDAPAASDTMPSW